MTKTAEERAQARTQQARAVAVAAAAAVVPPTFTPAQQSLLMQLERLRKHRESVALNRRAAAMASRELVRQAHQLGIGPSMIHDLTGISRTTIHKWIGKDEASE